MKQICSTITPGQPKILEYLSHHDSVIQKELAEACCIEPATLSTILTRMETEGLIRRFLGIENYRNVFVSLTDYGQECARQLNLIYSRVESEVFEGLSSDDFEQVKKALIQIRKNLKKQETAPPCEPQN